MGGPPEEERFLRYQVRAIRRFQSVRNPRTPQESDRLAMEWIERFAAVARLRWKHRVLRRAAAALTGDGGEPVPEPRIGQWNI